jgi:16S rRNA (adenine1518-N6/adenine1519-N6)-dimethyltransferase
LAHHPRKRFGQHFLHDPGVVRRIVAALAPRPGDRLVEVGPGMGALTGPLLEAAGTLDAVELDRDLAAALAASPEAREGRLRVHQGDALDFDFAALAGAGPPLRLVGNLPYNVSTPLLFHFLEARAAIADMHLMLQREVVARMAAAPGGKDYGRLSVMVQVRCRVERLFPVGPGAFTPPPKVMSEVVRLVPHPAPPVTVADPEVFARVVARAFAQRRKTLRNALRDLVAPEAMVAAGIDPGERAERLTLAQFAALADLAGTAGS